MNAASNAAPRRVGHGRPGTRRASTAFRTAALACAALALTLTGCSGQSQAPKESSADDTVQSLGAVPIPSQAPGHATPTADGQRPQLVAMGDSVRAHLADGDAVVTAGGPSQDVTGPDATTGKVPDKVKSTFTITVSQAAAPFTVSADEFSSRDDQGADIPLTASGPASVTAAPGGKATLTLVGTYKAGAAQLTWKHAGKAVVLWDFNIELD